MKTGIEPRRNHRLDSVRLLTSTGSPLAPEGFDFIYRSVKRELCMASISGGTDIMGCFVMGNPAGPVWRGEIATAVLGMAVEIYGDDGKPVPEGEKGELVCTRPFPTMPLGFWNDPDGTKYHAAYFDRFPGIWCHGDYAARTPHGGFVIHGRPTRCSIRRRAHRHRRDLPAGRADAGSAGILVIAQEWQHDVRIVLFVKLRDGIALDDPLIRRINGQIRANASPRHVPARIVQVGDIPRTKSGKIVELAVREVVHGRPVKNREALANPEALDFFRDRVELRS